jgi:anti-sigma factor ChrR (cupin superfamily)
MPEVSEDLAGEFALGALEADELAAVERRIRDEPDFRRAVDTWSRRLAPLLEQVSAKTPPVSAWSAIQRRVGGGGPSVARRRSEGVWLDISPGVQLKMLRVDPPTGERTALLRMQPGASCPEHDHSQVEECFVLEGEVNIDGHDYRPGDYVVARAGTRHDTIVSVPGGLLLLHWSTTSLTGAGLIA